MLNFIGKQFRKPRGLLGRLINRMMIKGNALAYDKILPLLNIEPSMHVFEIGYGHGRGIQRISNEYNCQISGIDFSELMYREASKLNNRKIREGKIELFFGDFLNPDFKPRKYDRIFCVNVVYFWDKLEEPFLKIHKSLNEGGVFYFYMAHRDELNKLKFTHDSIFSKHTIDHVVSELKSAGFKDVEYSYDRGYFVKAAS